ncbi:uncharacterized protein [Chanodichthys erythropterus]|uniref:uncharacterized protein isoform X2 n=1 Tax=Chanodichthys erythropterus TaxID=933992 RepID=UPI00351F269E
MRKVIIGIGGTTNGGKTTLSKSLQELLCNSCVISQDNFFKDDSVVPTDINGFKQYDSILIACSTRSTSCRSLMRHAKREEAQESMCLQIHQATLMGIVTVCSEDNQVHVQVMSEDEELTREVSAGVENRRILGNGVQGNKGSVTEFLDGTQKRETLLSTVLADIQEMLMVTQRLVITS